MNRESKLARKMSSLVERLADRLGIGDKKWHDPKFIELAEFITAVRQLQEDFVNAHSRLLRENDVASYNPEDFLLKTSKPLIQRYSSCELMLRVVIALLEEGFHPDKQPIQPENGWGRYVQSKLRNAIFPYVTMKSKEDATRFPTKKSVMV